MTNKSKIPYFKIEVGGVSIGNFLRGELKLFQDLMNQKAYGPIVFGALTQLDAHPSSRTLYLPDPLIHTALESITTILEYRIEAKKAEEAENDRF